MSYNLADNSDGLLTPAKRLIDDFDVDCSPDGGEAPSVSSTSKMKSVKIESDD